MDALIQERQQTLQAIEAGKARLEEIDDQLFDLLKDQCKEQGSTTIKHNGHKIVVTIPMKSEWDQEKLVEVEEKIRAHGEDPTEYIDLKRSVSEKKYKAWPASIQKVFEPARTIKPGKRKLEVKNG